MMGGEGTLAALKSVQKTIIDPALLLLIRKRRWEIEMDDRTVRVALERHWDASDASDFNVHEIYPEDAVLDYPHVERCGRVRIAGSR